MKYLNILLAASAMLVAGTATAEPITPEQALARVGGNNAPARAKVLKQDQPTLAYTQLDNSGTPAVYVFNSSTSDGGYMLLSADDCVAPVLGYSDSGEFVADNLPPALQWWLEEYANQVEYCANLQVDENLPKLQSTSTSRPAISPMITTHWDQGAPYFNKCPFYGTDRTWTGCVATSMAQVMNYWKYPAQGTGNISYTCSSIGKRLTLDFSRGSFDWANMLNNYDEGQYNDQQAAAVAYLMQAAGYSVKSEYGLDATGALAMDIRKALKKYFGYDPNMKYALRSLYSATQWETLIYENLRDCGPILYGGGSFIGGGHSFICDGYDGNGYFHFNWGWSGISDGYFALDALTPYALGTGGGGGGGYNFTQDAVLGIRPATGAEEIVEPLYLVQHGSLVGALAADGKTVSIDLEGEGDAMWVNYNTETMNVSFYLTFSPLMGTGNVVGADISQRVFTLQPGYGTGTTYLSNALDLTTLNLADGTYKVEIVTLNDDNPSEGYVPVVPCYGYNTYFTLTKNGDKFTVQNAQTPALRIVEGSIDNTLYYAGIARVSITVANDSDIELDAGFAPYLFLTYDGTDYPYFLGESVYLSVPAHQTITRTWDTSLTQMQSGSITTDTEFKFTFFNEKTYDFYNDRFQKNVTMYANLGAPDVRTTAISIPGSTKELRQVNGVNKSVFVIPDRNSFKVETMLSLNAGSMPLAYEVMACILNYPSSDGEILMNTSKPVIISDWDTFLYSVEMGYPQGKADTYYSLALAYIYGSYIVGFGSTEIICFENGVGGVENIIVDSQLNENTDNTIYNLQGMPMGTDLETLPAGLYIQSGKKVFKN